MSTGRYIMRGRASAGWRAASWALANGGAGPIPVAELTTRLTVVGTSRQRLNLVSTSAERLQMAGTSGKRLSLIGSSE